MTNDLPNPLNVVVTRDLETDRNLERIESVAPDRTKVTRVQEHGDTTSEEDAALAEAHVVLVGADCRRDIGKRAPKALWIHANFSGISELRDCDFWGTDILMTSARGNTSPEPIAEMALAGGLMIAKRLHYAARETATRHAGREIYRPLSIGACTMGIVGLGGIGKHLAKMAKGVGMRVLATRRTTTQRMQNVDGVDEIFPASDLLEMAKQCEFLALCLPATDDTDKIINEDVFNALPEGAIIINIARGELIDEEALLVALDSGKLEGAYLDTYAGERDHDVDPRMATHPKIVMTPHVSNRGHKRVSRALDLFCENLRLYLDGQPLKNRVDWERGY